MLATVLLVIALLQAGATDRPGSAARQIMREARLAAEGDSAPTVAARWQARLARDPADREAVLGLATAARLSADDSTASRWYRRLLELAPSRDDPYGVYARLGLARLAYEAVQMGVADRLASEALAGARAIGDSVAVGDALQAVGNARVDAAKSVGLAYHDSALGVLPAGETDLIAGVRCRRGLILFYMGGARAEPTIASGHRRRARWERCCVGRASNRWIRPVCSPSATPSLRAWATRCASLAIPSRRQRTCPGFRDPERRRGWSPATQPCPMFGSAATRASTTCGTPRSSGTR